MHQQEQEKRVEELRGHRWTEDEARTVLEAQRGSGETVPQFARRLGLDPQRLWWWRKRLGEIAQSEPAKNEPQNGPSALAHFLPLVVRAEAVRSSAPGPAAVLVSGCVRLEVRELSPESATWVALVAKALREGAP